MSLEKETLDDSLRPLLVGSSVEPDPGPGRTCSSDRAEATSRSSATATGAVFGPQLPVGSVGVSDLGTDKSKQVVLKKYPSKMFVSKNNHFLLAGI